MTDKQAPIVVVGSINMDLVAYTPCIPQAGETIAGTGFAAYPGGKGTNQPVAAATLGYPVAIIGRVGNDAFGLQLREGLRKAGVDTGAVITVPGASGVAVIAVDEHGGNCIIVTPGANDALTPVELDRHIDLIRSAGIVLAQLEIPLETVEHLTELCSQAGIPLMLDPAPACSLPRSLLQNVAWLTPNETEANTLLGESVSRDRDPARTADGLHTLGAQFVVLKLGGKGAYVSTKANSGFHAEPFRVNAADTTAAGDAFNGAFAVALMQCRSLEESARFASAAAAISVTRQGAQPSMPTLAEAVALLDSY